MAISKQYTDMNQKEWDSLPILAQRIRVQLDKQGITLNQLRQKAGITSTSVMKSYIDETPVDIRAYNLAQLADALGVTTDYLLGRTDTPTIEKNIATAEKTTGLSAEAIKELQSIPRISECNYLIESGFLNDLSWWSYMYRGICEELLYKQLEEKYGDAKPDEETENTIILPSANPPRETLKDVAELNLQKCIWKLAREIEKQYQVETDKGAGNNGKQ